MSYIFALRCITNLKGYLSHSWLWRSVIYAKAAKGESVYVWFGKDLYSPPSYTVGILWNIYESKVGWS